MFNNRSRILKKDEDMTELDEEVSKIVHDYEMGLKEDSAIKGNIEKIYISSVDEFNVSERNGSQIRCLLVRIPFKSLEAFRIIRNSFVGLLERKLNCFVFVVAIRRILSKRIKTPGIKKRPISRTLTHVYNCLLEDVALPSSIVGKQIRVHTDGSQTTKVFLDPLDKDKVEDRVDAMSEAYRRITSKKVKFLFAKPTKFQKQLAEFKKKQQQK